MGLTATATRFDQEFGVLFKANSRSEGEAFISPFEKVFFAGTDKEVPWSEPLLFALWSQWLESKGVERLTTGPDPFFDAVYSFHGKPVMMFKRDGGFVEGLLLTPEGRMERRTKFEIFSRNPVEIPDPTILSGGEDRELDPGEKIYALKGICDVDVQVRTFLGPRYSKDNERTALRKMAAALQSMPWEFLNRVFKGSPGEPPVTVILSNQKTAIFKKIIPETYLGKAAGVYNSESNTLWIDFPESMLEKRLESWGENVRGYVRHELYGHGEDDSLSPDVADHQWSSPSNGVALSYRKGVKALLSRKEIDSGIGSFEDLPAAEKEAREGARDKVWEKVSAYYPSEYALFGPYGIKAQLKDGPLEYFAVGRESLLRQLEGDQQWKEGAYRDKVFWAHAMSYLTDKYSLSTIGGVPADEVYSERGMETIWKNTF